MSTTRTYGDACAAAHALDLVGERWALLIVRDLLYGPKRFSDLRRGMPGASPNVLSQRLRELEAAGVLRRNRLGPPVSAQVYELTEWGAELRPVILHLGRWGRRSPFRNGEAAAGADSLMLALQARFDAKRAARVRIRCLIRLPDGFLVRVGGGRLDVRRGTDENVDAVLDAGTADFAALLSGADLGALEAHGRIRIHGDRTAIARLLATLEDNPAVAPGGSR